MQSTGFSFSDIQKLEIKTIQEYIRDTEKQKYDARIMDKIELYRMHGIEPTKEKEIGTDFYKKFIQEKRKENDKIFLENYKKKHKEKNKSFETMIESGADFLKDKENV